MKWWKLNEEWTPATSKKMALPSVAISVGYDEKEIFKLTREQQDQFPAEFAKEMSARWEETLTKARATIVRRVEKAESELDGKDATAVKKVVDDVQRTYAYACNDLSKAFIAKGTWLATTAYTSIAGKKGKVEAGATVTIKGKVEPDASTNTAVESLEAQRELATKLDEHGVSAAENDIDIAKKQSVAASNLAGKSQTSCDAVIKASKTFAKAPMPSTVKTITTTMKTIDKEMDTVEKMVSNAISKMRLARGQLQKCSAAAKELKTPAILTQFKLCDMRIGDVIDALDGFYETRPIVDQLGKGFNGKTIPDLPKLIQKLNALPQASDFKPVETAISKLHDMLAAFSK